jgi:RND family efflux transporter MFP subunit
MMVEPQPNNSDRPSGASQPPPATPPPPRGPAGWVIAAVIGAAVLGMVLGGRFAEPAARVWRDLVHAGHDHDAPQSAQYYTCGMHPWVVQRRPGLCPICHMELTPIDPAKFSGEVTINPVVVQNMGVRIQAVKTGPLVRTIRTVGTVGYDETRVRDVTTKFDGWIEKLHVNSTGAPVKQGDVLFEIYSPELYSAQEEYLLAWRRSTQTTGGAAVAELLESARTKLLYFDIDEQQLEELQRAGRPTKTMPIRSRINGVVIEKEATEGMKVEAGMRVFRLADLSRVWVMVTIYEYQLPYVQVGQTATISLPYIPGHSIEGKVVYVYPYLNERTRSAKVRLEFDNASGLLKPGMFANIELSSRLADDRVLAPRSAIIDTGTRRVAFVSLGQGRFEPRDVHLGVETQDGMVEVRDGLREGEMVVVSGQFLLDSEARVREALAKMIQGELASAQAPVAASAGEAELERLPELMAAPLRRALRDYFRVGDILAADTTEGIAPAARSLAGAVDDLLKVQVPGDAHFWHRHDEIATVRGKALELIELTDIARARLAYADLSVALSRLARATGVPADLGAEVHELHCPMYLEGQGGGIWLQPAGEVRNPYFGSVMLRCFDRRVAMPMKPVADGQETHGRGG